MVALGRELVDEMLKVTLEEYRLTEMRFETDSRLGRELLYLLSNNEWLRRTTETITIDRVSAADTTIVVDVDSGYVVHEALRLNEGSLWLPLIALPPDVPTGKSARSRGSSADGTRAAGTPAAGTQLRDVPVSLQVTDVTGNRLADLPQPEVRRQLAAALAETLVNRIGLRHEDDHRGQSLAREHQVLIAAAIAQLLATDRDRSSLADDAGEQEGTRRDSQARSSRLEHLQSVLEIALTREIELAETNVVAGNGAPAAEDPIRSDPTPSAMRSREAEILQAVRGIMLVVVPVKPHAGATSFTVRMPSRRLARDPDGRHLTMARLEIGLLVPGPDADRVIQVEMPEGVRCPPGTDGMLRVHAEITVQAPAQYNQLRLLVDQLTGADGLESWVRKQLAELAVVKLDAVIQSLRQHYTLISESPSATADLLGKLWKIRVPLDELSRGSDNAPKDVDEQTKSTVKLTRQWTDLKSDFKPHLKLHRRLTHNTVSPGSVRFGASAIDEFTLRSEPVEAFVELFVVPDDSPVLATASAVNMVNLALLAGVTCALLLSRGTDADEVSTQAQVLSAVLAIFPTIQASRVTRPDPGRLNGRLQVPHFWLGLFTAVPGVLLAGALAFTKGGMRAFLAAIAALALQVAGQVWISRLRKLPGPSWEPGIQLYTEFAPDHAELDALHTVWCRSLTGEALLFGRTAFPYLVIQEDKPNGLLDLLSQVQGGRPKVAFPALIPLGDVAGRTVRQDNPSVNLLGLLLGAAAEQTAMFLVFRDEPEGLEAPPPPGSPFRLVRRVPVGRNRLVPVEPSAWVLDVMVGIERNSSARTPLHDHPLRVVADATSRARLSILNVRLPAPPPHDYEDREWLRLRIGVPHRPGESLSTLVSFLDELQQLRLQEGIILHLREVPQMATLDSTQTAPEDTFEAVPGKSDESRESFLVTVDQVEVLNDDTPDAWRWLLPVCAPARVGLMSRLMDSISRQDSTLSLTAALTGTFSGISVIFLLCRGTGERGDDEIREMARQIQAELQPGDHAMLPIKAARSSGPVRPHHADDEDGLRALLRVQVRTPDRAGALQHLLIELHARLCEAVGEKLGHLDVLYALTPVVDGQALSGRLVLGLPAMRDLSTWERVPWQEVGRVVSRNLANGGQHSSDGSYDRTSRLSDDTVVTLDLVRAVEAGADHTLDA
jgi:hypothetical protein